MLTREKVDYLRTKLVGLEDGDGNSLDAEVHELCDQAIRSLSEREAVIEEIPDIFYGVRDESGAWLGIWNARHLALAEQKRWEGCCEVVELRALSPKAAKPKNGDTRHD